MDLLKMFLCFSILSDQFHTCLSSFMEDNFYKWLSRWVCLSECQIVTFYQLDNYLTVYSVWWPLLSKDEACSGVNLQLKSV